MHTLYTLGNITWNLFIHFKKNLRPNYTRWDFTLLHELFASYYNLIKRIHYYKY